MKFSYKAVTPKGEKISGTAEAADKYELAHHVRGQGNTLVFAEMLNAPKSFDLSRINALLSRVKMQDKIIFAKNLGAMLKAGLSLSRAIGIMEKQTGNEKFKKTLSEMGSDIAKGSTLSDSLAKSPDIFSSLFVAMVKAGEESGSLAESLNIVGGQMEKTYMIQRKIRGALLYPAIIICAMFVVGALMLVYVVPTLTATFKELNVDLPISTQVIVAISDFLVAHTIIALLSFILTVGLAIMFFRSPRGKRIADFTMTRIPLIGPLVKKINAARTARTLSSLLSSGVDIVEALGITRDVVQNSYYKEVLEGAQKSIQKGSQLSRAFSEAPSLYPILVGEMVEVGEETGKLSDMLLQVALFYEEEVEEATKNMATIVEPFLMIMVGAVVGFFAVSMISPTYSLLNNI